MADYAGPAIVKLNGRPLLQVQMCKVSRASNAKAVKTLALGLAGKTKGAPEVSISLTNAVPAAGYEATFNDLVFTQDDVTIGIVMGNVEEAFFGWFDTSDTSSAVDTPIDQECAFHGRRTASASVG